MQPVEELRYLVLAVQREGNRTLTEALRPLELTPSQAEVLRVLQEFQPLSLFALGDLLICETGSPSRLVNGMVEAGLIERVPSITNRRMVIYRREMRLPGAQVDRNLNTKETLSHIDAIAYILYNSPCYQ